MNDGYLARKIGVSMNLKTSLLYVNSYLTDIIKCVSEHKDHIKLDLNENTITADLTGYANSISVIQWSVEWLLNSGIVDECLNLDIHIIDVYERKNILMAHVLLEIKGIAK